MEEIPGVALEPDNSGIRVSLLCIFLASMSWLQADTAGRRHRVKSSPTLRARTLLLLHVELDSRWVL